MQCPPCILAYAKAYIPKLLFLMHVRLYTSILCMHVYALDLYSDVYMYYV